MRIDYDHIDDALYVTLIPVEAMTSIEVAAGVLADYDAEGRLIGLLVRDLADLGRVMQAAGLRLEIEDAIEARPEE
ncbi:MAG TPA: DUF2283 domain-containing protein [Thermomicrobiales bacterium]|jgi:uncharacterized protein YuzE|nr:DUF2283 domain-containing protein [Thermomicrobiales bacterium]